MLDFVEAFGGTLPQSLQDEAAHAAPPPVGVDDTAGVKAGFGRAGPQVKSPVAAELTIGRFDDEGIVFRIESWLAKLEAQFVQRGEAFDLIDCVGGIDEVDDARQIVRSIWAET
jgi:hypothetical protein